MMPFDHAPRGSKMLSPCPSSLKRPKILPGQSKVCWWGSWRVKVAAEPSCQDWGQRLSKPGPVAMGWVKAGK
eukprot:34282_3